jgi:hypothetical protein
MTRCKKFENSKVVSVRFESEEYETYREMALLESLATGRNITTLDLIRDCCRFVFRDGERMRECFRRSRAHINKRVK